MIRLVGRSGSPVSQLDEAALAVEFVTIDCTSHNPDEVMRKGLSPFYLGPVKCYDGLESRTFELAWQCAKIYPNGIVPVWDEANRCFGKDKIQDFVDSGNGPAAGYYRWRDGFWARRYPDDFANRSYIRFPAGKGNAKHCLYSWWPVDGEYRKLDYVEARKQIYMPLYARSVVKTEAYRRLCELRDAGKNLLLVDFDGYNIHHSRYNFTYNDAINCPYLKMGHGFVLAMLLEGLIVVEGDEVMYAEGLLESVRAEWPDPRELRKLSEDARIELNMHTLGVTREEYMALDETTCKWLRKAARKDERRRRGFSKAKWKQLSLAEKLAFRV